MADRSSGATADMKAYQRAWALSRKYGLTLDDFNAMCADQGHACPICTKPLSGKICVDHDPTVPNRRASVRGVIHDACNKGMGALGDDAGNCRRAAEYLDAYAQRRQQET